MNDTAHYLLTQVIKFGKTTTAEFQWHVDRAPKRYDVWSIPRFLETEIREYLNGTGKEQDSNKPDLPEGSGSNR